MSFILKVPEKYVPEFWCRNPWLYGPNRYVREQTPTTRDITQQSGQQPEVKQTFGPLEESRILERPENKGKPRMMGSSGDNGETGMKGPPGAPVLISGLLWNICPLGWMLFEDRCYLFVDTEKEWTEAEV
ncbi:hypothetical protein AMECASPLE_013846 [Ameca splendens]|uniref:Uncharacterized protein n=1 Tax=Ameca splendens TaxID=208324 RepID=A0ABV0YZI6_9TELE